MTTTIGATVKIAATVNNYGNRLGVVYYITDDAEPIYGVRLDGDNWITQFARTEIAGPITTAIAWQLAPMDEDDDDEVCRNGKPWADCNCC